MWTPFGVAHWVEVFLYLISRWRGHNVKEKHILWALENSLEHKTEMFFYKKNENEN